MSTYSDTHSAHSGPGGLFGVLVDPRTYGALFYMLLSLALGIFYFTWAVTGIALSLGLFILIIGIPFTLLFIGSVRVIGWVEGKLVEGLLGAQLPASVPAAEGRGVWSAIKSALTDARTWGTLFYMILMLPLGIIYFTLAVTLGATSLGLMGGGAYELSGGNLFDTGHWDGRIQFDGNPQLEAFLNSTPGYIVCILAGAVLFLLMLHIVRGIGYLHARIAEGLLVRW